MPTKKKPVRKSAPRVTKHSQEKMDAIASINALGVKRGSVIYTVLRSSAASGTRRVIDLIFFRGRKANGDVDARTLSYNAAIVLGRRMKGDGMVSGGGGMDMGFEAVYSLAHAMFGDGYALEQRWL